MNFHHMAVSELKKLLDTNINEGLSEEEASKRILNHGKNELVSGQKKGVLKRFFAQFSDFMIIVLIVSALVSFLVSYISGEKDITDPIIIMAIVILNAVIGTVQESRAIEAIEGLKKLTQTETLCIRNGTKRKVLSEDIVPGDVIILSGGDTVPADCRLIESGELYINESALTGEAEAVLKNASAVHDENTSLSDRTNCIFSSTQVVSGKGKAVVFSTGMNTEVGKVASLMKDSKEELTPLQKKLGQAGKVLALFAFLCCLIVFIMGLARNYSPFFMFMTSVSLAVAAIPEGLPAIVTVILAMGVSSMAKRRAVVRNLPAVETLGSATVICSDKTGTLTQNKMKVSKVHGDRKLVLKLMYMCSNNDREFQNATEQAVVEEYKSEWQSEEPDFNKTAELPFNSERKRMTVSGVYENGYITVVKGAFDVIFPGCSFIWEDGEKKRLTEEKKREQIKRCNEMASHGLRVIAVAYRNDKKSSLDEINLVFAGMVALSDPLRPEVKESIKRCMRAGIEVIMITGDHKETALAIGKELGIDKGGAVSGKELSEMDDAGLKKVLKKTRIFARVLPEHKVRIVRVLKSMGHVVAMTGDGVNDAPALKAADIGCAMGKCGTDVARSASDMVLTDDNFATIVEAVSEGRIIYGNIKKAIHFLLSSNTGEILSMMAGLISGMGAPLLPIQLLWVNLITDSLPAIALGMDREDGGEMEKPPVDPKKGFFSGGFFIDMLTEGALIGAVSIVAFSKGLYTVGSTPAVSRTMAFCTLSISQLIHAFAVRTKKSAFKPSSHNKWLIGAFLTGVFLQCSVVLVPFLRAVFKTAPLSVEQWLWVLGLSIIPLIVSEIDKSIKRRSKLHG